jgi:hypothetical protein
MPGFSPHGFHVSQRLTKPRFFSHAKEMGSGKRDGDLAGTLQPEAARLCEVPDDVKAALPAGASHAAVLVTLHAQGLALTPLNCHRKSLPDRHPDQ